MNIIKFTLQIAYKIYLKIRKVDPTRKKGKRRYIHPDLGVAGFFDAIKSCDYVVLRWFEELPYVIPGEDIDILVSDEHLELIDKYLTGSKLYGIPCDIYTCGGLPGTDYRSVSYYPVKKAENIIKNSVLLQNSIKAPNAKDYLFSMIYHVVYHKGADSGIQTDLISEESVLTPDHNYTEIIKNLAKSANIKLPEIFSLEGLDVFLDENGWKPQNDTLKKLSKRNIWVREMVFSAESDLALHWNGFTLFIIREKGIPFLHEIKKLLWIDGFDIVYEQEIPFDKREIAVSNIRGGNWNRGPWPKSGGFPVYVFAVYDLHPLEVDKVLAEKHIGIENARISKTKIRIRDHINRLMDKSDWCNVLHSADNPVEALEYASYLIPNQISDINEKIQKLNITFNTPYPVIKNLTRHARRAKIEIVNFNGVEAVCKTFKPERDRFMQREILARELKGSLTCISEILETGRNYIILKKYDDILDNVCNSRSFFKNKKLLPVNIITEIKKIISHYRSLGYECIDFSPGNLIYDRIEGLKVVDFEFLQKGKISSSKLKGCYAWYKIPEDFNGDQPQLKIKKTFYNSRWKAKTGVALFFCVYNFPAYVISIAQFIEIYFFQYLRNINKLRRIPTKIISLLKTKLNDGES